MENNLVLNNTYFLNDNIDEINLNRNIPSNGSTSLSPAIVNMVAEGGKNFFQYLKSLGLSKEPNLIVLSSSQHYYYDESDLRSVRTLINLKKLNLIKHLDKFLHTLFRILPQNANFIGCFSDNNSMKRNNGFPFYQPSRILDRFINLLDFKTEYKMSKNEVLELLEKHGFKIVDMTEMNGLTYFYSQNVQNRLN